MNTLANQNEIAEEAARYVMGKIAPLQKGYTGSNNAASTRARATLATLRRLNTSAGANAFLVGEQLFSSWPHERLCELGARPQDEDRMQATVEAVLGLYAIHQQSSEKGCAIVRSGQEDESSYHARCKAASFGRACRKIEPDLSETSGIQRRLAAIEAASDFDGVVYGLRGLIRLMKPTNKRRVIQLDYGGLTRDLYALQLSSGARDYVMTRWARDYFSNMQEATNRNLIDSA